MMPTSWSTNSVARALSSSWPVAATRALGLLLALVLVVFAEVPAMGHHAFAAEFDSNKPVTLKGTVSKVEWTNPHMWLYVDVKGPDGSVVTWAVEGGAPNALFRRGFRKDSFPLGIVVTVEGFQAKSGKAVANGRNVIYPNGAKLMMGATGTGEPKS